MVDCTGLENRRTERYRGFESLPLRKKLGNNFHCFLIFILRKREARLPADAKWKLVETRKRFLISCKGTPKRDGRAKRSQFRPQSRQKTKQGKRDSVLVSCKGIPKRDGREKRSQFRTPNSPSKADSHQKDKEKMVEKRVNKTFDLLPLRSRHRP